MEALSTPDRDSDIFIPQPPSHTHSARLRKRQSEMTLSTATPPVTMATRRTSLPSAPVTSTAPPSLVSPVSSTATHTATPPPSSRSESSKYTSTESQDPVSSLPRVKRSTTPLTPAEDSTERGQQEEEEGLVEEKVEGGEEKKEVSPEPPPPPRPEPGSPPATHPVSFAPPHSKPHRSVAVIQPTQVCPHLPPHHACVSGVLLLSSQHHTQAPVGSPPFEPPLPPHCYGAIGPPQSRRGSVPMAPTGRSSHQLHM